MINDLRDHNNMTSKISYRVENDVLMCFVTGERSSNETMEYWQESVDKCQSEDLSRIQMNLAMNGRFGPFEAIQNYQSIIQMLKSTNLRIAVVDINLASAPDSQVACNMGASQGLDVSYFASEKEAKAWLLSDLNNLNKIA